MRLQEAIEKLEECRSLLEQISAEEVDDPEELATEFSCEGLDYIEAIDVILAQVR